MTAAKQNEAAKQDEKVRDFFNRISDAYSEKYSEFNLFHNWYFNERLHAATGESKIDFNGKTILDIGTGTGALYDFLTAKGFSRMTFIGCDVAEKMMEATRLPKENRFTGHCYEIDFPIKHFDYVFVLGVSTYMDETERDRTLDFIQQSLSEEGTAVISFTNKASLDQISHSIARPFLRVFQARNRVSGQSFRTYSYTKKQLRELLDKRFRFEKLIDINQTVCPFNHLFPRSSIRVARFIQRIIPGSPLLHFLSAECLAVLKARTAGKPASETVPGAPLLLEGFGAADSYLTTDAPLVPEERETSGLAPAGKGKERGSIG